MQSSAAELIREAEKKLKGGWFSSPQFEDAAELYTKAGNVYKMSKQVQESADCYKKAADCYLRAKSGHNAATSCQNAASALRKTHPTEAVQCIEKCADFYSQEGRWSMAAKCWKDMAEIREKESDGKGALAAYLKAAEMFEGDNAPSSADGCRSQAALIAAQDGDYPQAAQLFDQLANACLESKLRQFNFRQFAFNAVLCQLASQDLVAAKRLVEKYHGLEPGFASTREYRLLVEVCTAVEAFDADAFTAAVQEFNSVITLDNWKSTLLLKVRDSIKKDEAPSLT